MNSALVFPRANRAKPATFCSAARSQFREHVGKAAGMCIRIPQMARPVSRETFRRRFARHAKADDASQESFDAATHPVCRPLVRGVEKCSRDRRRRAILGGSRPLAKIWRLYLMARISRILCFRGRYSYRARVSFQNGVLKKKNCECLFTF